MKLQFKFTDRVSQNAREGVIDRLLQSGAQAVRPLLPGEGDEELARLFVADVDDEQTGRELLNLLQSSADVEYAETEVRRKLIR